MSSSRAFCVICLRIDRKLRRIPAALSEYHDELSNSLIEDTSREYCSECEHLLRKSCNFHNRCKASANILNKWKKMKGRSKPPIDELHLKLPSRHLNVWTPENTKFITYKDSDEPVTIKEELDEENVHQENLFRMEIHYESDKAIQLLETHLQNSNEVGNTEYNIENRLPIDNTIQNYITSDAVLNVSEIIGHTKSTNANEMPISKYTQILSNMSNTTNALPILTDVMTIITNNTPIGVTYNAIRNEQNTCDDEDLSCLKEEQNDDDEMQDGIIFKTDDDCDDYLIPSSPPRKKPKLEMTKTSKKSSSLDTVLLKEKKKETVNVTLKNIYENQEIPRFQETGEPNVTNDDINEKNLVMSQTATKSKLTHTIADLDTINHQCLEIVEDYKIELHNPKESFMECSTADEPSSSHRPVRRPLAEEEIFLALEYNGSEADDDHNDDEDVEFPPLQSGTRTYDRVTYDDTEDVDDNELPPVVIDNVETATTAADTVGPHNLYHFEWRAFSDPPISPKLRRESFSSHQGPTAPNPDPYQTFISIWDREIMEHIAAETNAYAQEVAADMANRGVLAPNSRICSWRDVTVDELYTLFAMFIAMGLVIKGKIKDYWCTAGDIFSTPGFRVNMPLRRFELLSACLHFKRNGNMPSNLDAGQAKLYKLQPILNHLNSKFQSLYDLSRNIALDESLLKWKGWLNINQFIPNKAAHMGIKSYELCESQTGYLWRFEIHSVKVGIPPSTDPMCSAIPAIVLRLVQGLEYKGHTLWMDNFYNSPALARTLKSLGTDCVGTLRINRQFVPPGIKSLTKENMKPGQISSVTSGDVDLTVWRDCNRVATISTYHGNAVFEVGGVKRPTLIYDYNVMMGGVDKKDQMVSSYPMERKRTKIWYKKVFRRLLNVSVLNCYIISKQSGSSSNHRICRENLVRDILRIHSQNSRQIRMPTAPATMHDISLNPLRASGIGRLRRRCTVCNKQTITHCALCNKPLCAIGCFSTLHNEPLTI